jgi:hypothetical protein
VVEALRLIEARHPHARRVARMDDCVDRRLESVVHYLGHYLPNDLDE